MNRAVLLALGFGLMTVLAVYGKWMMAVGGAGMVLGGVMLYQLVRRRSQYLSAFFWTYWLAGWRPGLAMAAEGPLYRRATTMTLSAIVAGQVGNVFACRTDRESVLRVGLFSNPRVLVGIAAEIGLLVALVLVPPLPAVFHTAALSFSEWGALLALPPIMLGLEEGRKWMVRRAGPPEEVRMTAVAGEARG